jgi:hypothetical protein
MRSGHVLIEGPYCSGTWIPGFKSRVVQGIAVQSSMISELQNIMDLDTVRAQ